MAITENLIGNLTTVVVLISLGTLVRFAINFFELNRYKTAHFASYSFFILSIFAGVNANIDENFYLFFFSVCSIWALMFVNIHVLIRILESTSKLKN